MDEITYALLLVLTANVMFFLGQAAVIDLNPQATVFYHCQGSLLGQFEQQGCTVNGQYSLNNTDPIHSLPTGDTTVSPTTGNIFTDSFTALKNWLLNELGLGYLLNILSAPYNFLNALSFPAAFTYAIGTLWYAFTLFLFIAWLLSR